MYAYTKGNGGLNQRRKPSRQAIEMSVELLAKQLGIRNRLLVAALYQPSVHIVSHIVVAEAAKAPRRRRALSDSFHQIHQMISLLSSTATKELLLLLMLPLLPCGG
uniref:Uncharacterized protein n=1 Tax=Rhizophora mucronata TaxID=61149 RepID=A0A2P2LTA9_RHIMU